MNVHVIDSGMKVEFDDQYFGRKSYIILPTEPHVAVNDLLVIRSPAKPAADGFSAKPAGNCCIVAAVTHLEPLPPDRQIVSFRVFGLAREKAGETTFILPGPDADR